MTEFLSLLIRWWKSDNSGTKFLKMLKGNKKPPTKKLYPVEIVSFRKENKKHFKMGIWSTMVYQRKNLRLKGTYHRFEYAKGQYGGMKSKYEG